jgi:isoamylase
LNDLVSYDRKHNESNNDGNRDGGNDNMSWNCGVEGPTDDPAIEALRNRQVKNFLAVTLLSIGMPMIVMGDEVRRTQGGNNNGYCHDDESTWFDWTALEKHADVHRFVKLLCARRVIRSTEHERHRLTLAELIKRSNKSWHGVKLGQPDWGDSSRSIAFTVELQQDRLLVHLIFNAYWEPLDFELPQKSSGRELQWRRWIDTSLPSPDDIAPWQEAPAARSLPYRAGPRSVVVLYAPLGPAEEATSGARRQANA